MTDTKQKITVKVVSDNRSFLNGNKTIEETYRSKELREHIYSSPDTYAGSIDPEDDEHWFFDETQERMVFQKIVTREAFFKIFDEIIVNAIDQDRRLREAHALQMAATGKSNVTLVNKIAVDLDYVSGRITVENTGDGVEIVKREGKPGEEGIYIPQLLFGELLTSTNYDEHEERTVGGKNGYGAKITNILSTEFTVETVDRHRGLKYTQRFCDNMKVTEPPVITSYKKAPYTRISYVPDYKRFNIEDCSKIDDWKIITRRVYDAVACTDSSVSIYLNGKKLASKNFEDYMNLYIGKKSETKRIYADINERWQVGVCLSPDGEFHQVSFVNGIFTDRGGRHVDHIVTNLTKKLADHFAEKSKKNKELDLKPAFIKKNIFVFVKSIIVNPNFDTQTKRKLTTLVPKFGSRGDLPDEFIEKIAKLGILERAKALSEFSEKQKLLKTMSAAVSRGSIRHPKLTDAPAAGTRESGKCIIVFTEGDSAKAFMEAGLKGIPDKEHKYWGYFPLRGKLLNVRQATAKQLSSNEEIKMIMKIVGLREGQDYSKTSTGLRYGRIMILADADDDGHHIKGLLMNMISFYWPSLAQRAGFICDMATPIVKLVKTNEKGRTVSELEFFSVKKFDEWVKDHGLNGMSARYYKGLGSYEPREAAELCEKMRITSYNWSDETECKHKFELAFAKKMEDPRKEWLNNGVEPDPESLSTNVSYDQFIDHKLKIFSNADNKRSIPSVFDGLKPGQRKCLFPALSDDELDKDVKVGQYAGVVTAKANYHHGETSLHGTIMGMARDYVGVNNINLLVPAGQFGSRSGGGTYNKKGDDAAAARYCNTRLHHLTRYIFPKDDLILLKHRVEDGKVIEPYFYVPIIPMILVNGCIGIGTGYSTTVPSYNPFEIIENLRLAIAGQPLKDMIPWFRGYNGKIIDLGKGKFLTVGDYIVTDENTIRVRELPVGAKGCKSYCAYKEFLQDLLDDDTEPKKKAGPAPADDSSDIPDEPGQEFKEKVLKDFIVIKKTNTDFIVDIIFKDGFLQRELANNKGWAFEKKMKLAYAFATSNMHAHNADNIITKYDTPLDIIRDFFPARSQMYIYRKELQLQLLKLDADQASMRFRFVTEIINKTIHIYEKTTEEINTILSTASPPYLKLMRKADIIDAFRIKLYGAEAHLPKKQLLKKKKDEDDEEGEGTGSYDYLLNMKIRSFSIETLNKLAKERDAAIKAHSDLEMLDPKDIWLSELSVLEREYRQEIRDWIEINKLTVIEPRVKIVPKQHVPLKIAVTPKLVSS